VVNDGKPLSRAYAQEEIGGSIHLASQTLRLMPSDEYTLKVVGCQKDPTHRLRNGVFRFMLAGLTELEKRISWSRVEMSTVGQTETGTQLPLKTRFRWQLGYNYVVG
jgi:hypothetical protein